MKTNKTIKTIVAAALVSGAVLATDAAADYVVETGGMAYDKTGSNPFMFTY